MPRFFVFVSPRRSSLFPILHLIFATSPKNASSREFFLTIWNDGDVFRKKNNIRDTLADKSEESILPRTFLCLKIEEMKRQIFYTTKIFAECDLEILSSTMKNIECWNSNVSWNVWLKTEFIILSFWRSLTGRRGLFRINFRQNSLIKLNNSCFSK